MNELPPLSNESTEPIGHHALDRAISGLKQTTVPATTVERVTRTALELSSARDSATTISQGRTIPTLLGPMRPWQIAWIGGLGLMVLLYSSRMARERRNYQPVPQVATVRCSPITQVVLPATSLHAMEQELSENERRMDATSEALQLLIIREEIRTLLEESTDWRDR